MTGMMKSVAVAALVGCGVLAGSGAVQAQSYGHIHRLAEQLEHQAEDLHEEIHAHFRNCPQYRHLDSDVAQLERLARHIHDLVDRRASLAHVRADLDQLDHLYHHIQGLVRQMAYFGQLDRQAFRHFQYELRNVGDTLHHLRDDLARLDVHHHHGHSHGPVPVYPSGFRVGGFRITIGR